MATNGISTNGDVKNGLVEANGAGMKKTGIKVIVVGAGNIPLFPL
jgi:hypothetical protein